MINDDKNKPSDNTDIGEQFQQYDLSEEEREAESMLMLMEQIKHLRDTNTCLSDEERRK